MAQLCLFPITLTACLTKHHSKGPAWPYAGGLPQAVEAQAAAIVGRQRLCESGAWGVPLHRWKVWMKQLRGGVRPGCPLRRGRWGWLELGLRRTLWCLYAGTWRLWGCLCALCQAGVWRRCSGLGLRLGLGQWLQDLSTGLLQHRGLQDGLLATVLALLLASL